MATLHRCRPPFTKRGRPVRQIQPALLLSFAIPLVFALQPLSTPVPPGNASAGEALFTGARSFQKGGPPCGACHSNGALGFPNGGTMGPDLTREYSKLGDEGMDAVLETLYFPTMLPLFQNRMLTPDEQSDLKAFFQQSASRPPQNLTVIFAVIAVVGFLILTAASRVLWRDRLRAVRAPLIKAAGEPRS